jgi:hypothetical protein
MTRACGADDIKNILHPALFRKLRFQMIDDILCSRTGQFASWSEAFLTAAQS